METQKPTEKELLDGLIDRLLKDYKKPEDVIGENGLLKQLTKAASWAGTFQAGHQYTKVTGITPIKEYINETAMDSDDRVRRGALDGCAWNGSGTRRKDHRARQFQR